MMNAISLIIIIGFLSVSFFVGNFIHFCIIKQPSSNKFYNSFIKLIIGFFAIIIPYAVFKTSGNTVMWGFLLMAVLWVYRNTRINKALSTKQTRNNFIRTFDFSVFGLSLFIGILFFILQGYFFYNTPFNNLPQGDYAFYAMVVDYIRCFGIESYVGAEHPFLAGIDAPVPYHYSELWAASLFCELFSIHSLESQVVIVHSILAVVLSIGMIALVSQYTASFYWKVLSVLSLFITGIIVFRFLPQTDSYIFASGWNPKLMMISIFLVWFFILLKEKIRFFYFPLLLLPLVNIATAPTILTSLVLFVVLDFFIHKKLKQINWKIIFDIVIVAVFIAMFYLLNSKSNAAGDFTLSNIIAGLRSDYIKPFSILGGSIFIFISIYLLYIIPFLILLLTKYRSKMFIVARSQTISRFIPVVLFVTGLVMWSISNTIVDSIQFFYLTTILPFNIILLISFVYITEKIIFKKSIWKKILFIYYSVLIGICLFNLKNTPFYKYTPVSDLYSHDYLMSLSKKLFAEDNNKVVGVIRNPESVTNYWDAVSSYSRIYCLHLFESGYRTVPLDVLDIDLKQFQGLEQKRIHSYIKETDFHIFFKIKQESKNIVSISNLQGEFMIENNIQMLVLDKGMEMPDNMDIFVDTVISDIKSNQQFVFLKPHSSK